LETTLDVSRFRKSTHYDIKISPITGPKSPVDSRILRFPD